jgi:hypothetical protein
MKPFIVLLVTIVFLTACKKKRTCNCSIRKTGVTVTRTQSPGFPPLLPGSDTTTTSPYSFYDTSKTEYEKVSEKKVRSSCPSHSEETTNNSNVSAVPGIYTITTSESGKVTRECTID